jgi:hypothetical protein
MCIEFGHGSTMELFLENWSLGPQSQNSSKATIPRKELLMRVTYLDPVTGAFRLEQVVPANFGSPVMALNERRHAA